MATINTVITEARYDLRDVNSELYTDTELYYYANRALKNLDDVLSALHSDWVYTETDLTLSSGDNYVAAPTGCIVVRSAWISSTELVKVLPELIYQKRKYISATGEPYFFAENGANLIFEYTADDDYTVKTYADIRATALVSGGSMPYNDEFNSLIREMVVTLAHKRNEVNVFPDTEIYNFFYTKMIGNVIRRNHTPARTVLDF